MKEELYQRALNWVTKKGFQDIRANTESYEPPVPFSRPNEDQQIIPDITGKMMGQKSYIEIVSKEEDTQKIVTKWKLLEAVARMKGGKLYLLAGRGYKTFAANIIKDYNLQNAKIVSI